MGGGTPAGTKKFFDDNAALMSRLIHGGNTLYVGGCGGAIAAGMFYDEMQIVPGTRANLAKFGPSPLQ